MPHTACSGRRSGPIRYLRLGRLRLPTDHDEVGMNIAQVLAVSTRYERFLDDYAVLPLAVRTALIDELGEGSARRNVANISGGCHCVVPSGSTSAGSTVIRGSTFALFTASLRRFRR